MSRIDDILLKVRDVLADHAGTRWPDATLLRHLTSGVNDFLLRAKVTKSTLFIALETNIGLYSIKDFSQEIVRVQYLGKALTVKTTKDMDELDPDWENTTGIEPKFVIFDTYPQGTFRIYPKVTELAVDAIAYNSLYGAIIDIENTDDLYKLPSDSLSTLNVTKYLKVTYIKKQNTITLSSVLDLDSMYDDALVFYTSGMALRNDADTQNRAFGAEQLKLYDSVLLVAKGNESGSNNALSPIETSYKGFQ